MRTEEKNRMKEPLHATLLRVIALKKAANKKRTAGNYQSALNKFSSYLERSPKSISLPGLTPALVQDYKCKLEQQGNLSPGTIDFYLRTLRAMYNHAVNYLPSGPPGVHPFTGVRTNVPPTRKRNLCQDDICRLTSLDPPRKRSCGEALHIALFSFYARGMCFIDIFNLQKSNISNGYIYYNRSKTNVPMQVQITAEMQTIIDTYAGSPQATPWVFPFLHEKRRGKGNISSQSALKRINRNLRAIGKKANLPFELTTYTMRYSWATMMLEAGAEVSMISQCMGHTSIHTTEIYLNKISAQKVDKIAGNMLDTMVRNTAGTEKETDIKKKENTPKSRKPAPPRAKPRQQDKKKCPSLTKKGTFFGKSLNVLCLTGCKDRIFNNMNKIYNKIFISSPMENM